MSQRAWAAVAQQMGLAYDGVTVTGRWRGKAVSAVCERDRWRRITALRASSAFDVPLDLGLSVAEDGEGVLALVDHYAVMADQLFGETRSPELIVGDSTFDERFVVAGDESERAHALLSGSMGAAVRAAPRYLTMTDHEIRIRAFPQADVARWLMPAIDVVASVALQVDQTRSQVRPAAPLAPYVRMWDAFARAHGLHGATTPLCVWGRVEGAEVYARSARVDYLKYQLSVGVRFPRPLGLGLTVCRPPTYSPFTPRSDRREYWSLRERDIELGDSVFDDAFLVLGWDDAQVCALLHAEVRREILRIQHELGPVRITDDGLTVRLPFVPRDPTIVLRTVHRMLGLTERLKPRNDCANAYR